jgi:hypothetical protein
VNSRKIICWMDIFLNIENILFKNEMLKEKQNNIKEF